MPRVRSQPQDLFFSSCRACLSCFARLHNIMSYSDERYPLGGNTGSPFGPPPAWKEYEQPSPRGSKWNPRNWSRKTILIALGVAAIVLVVLIVGIYFGVQNNSYPDYTPLTYQLQDTYSGPDFFNNFDYFTGYDPTYGFVSDNAQASDLTLPLTAGCLV